MDARSLLICHEIHTIGTSDPSFCPLGTLFADLTLWRIHMKDIATLTINPALDISTTVSKVMPDRKLRCGPAERESGGGGINVSRAIKRLGGDAAAVYPAGGETGTLFQTLLDEEKIPNHPTPIRGLTRESFSVLEKSSGHQFRFSTPGPELDKKEWSRCLEELTRVSPNPDYVVGSGGIPPGVPEDFYARAAEKAKELGARFILDTHGKPLAQAASKGIYLIKANMNEIQELLGEKIQNETHLEDSLERLLSEGTSEIIVVSLGAAGALMLSQEGRYRIRAPIVPIRSRVGAGDSMVAGMTMGLAQGYSLTQALMYGIAAGSAAVMTPGTELCKGEDARNLFHRLIENSKDNEP